MLLIGAAAGAGARFFDRESIAVRTFGGLRGGAGTRADPRIARFVVCHGIAIESSRLWSHGL